MVRYNLIAYNNKPAGTSSFSNANTLVPISGTYGILFPSQDRLPSRYLSQEIIPVLDKHTGSFDGVQQDSFDAVKQSPDDEVQSTAKYKKLHK